MHFWVPSQWDKMCFEYQRIKFQWKKWVTIFTFAFGQGRGGWPPFTVSLTVKYPLFFTPSLMLGGHKNIWMEPIFSPLPPFYWVHCSSSSSVECFPPVFLNRRPTDGHCKASILPPSRFPPPFFYLVLFFSLHLLYSTIAALAAAFPTHGHRKGSILPFSFSF